MESFMQLINEWEIQLLVLLSFTLQVFLFFTGNLRRCSTNMFLRVSIWLAYLGADFTAVYALGYLSRHGQVAMEGEVHLLTFFWAPFLIIHLGGQDTITAFAMEDNSLWLRHLLTLIVQVSLALYVSWKSIGRHNLDLLVPGIFLYVSGVIKYGERTLSLMYGSLKITSQSASEVKKEELPETDGDDDYSSKVRSALLSAVYVQDLFAGNNIFESHVRDSYLCGHQSVVQSPKSLEVQLGMMYDDLYTKAILLRTRSGIVLRCISQISALVAFVLFFLVSNKQRFNRADVAITYALLVGGFLLDVCAVFILIKSPWTWAWLKARRCHALARASWFLFSSKIGWAVSKPLWSNSLGQYSLLSWVEGSDEQPITRSCSKQQMWAMFEKMMNSVGIKKENLFWISKLLDIKYTELDQEVMHNILKLSFQSAEGFAKSRQWPRSHGLLEELRDKMNTEGFAYAVVDLHIFTELHLRGYHERPTMEETTTASSQDVQGMVRKLSNYMIYLLATNPAMLPVTGQVDAILQSANRNHVDTKYGLWTCNDDALEKLRDLWILFLAYAAGKSRAEMHAARLGKGGELLTFLWMLMSHGGLGDAGLFRIELVATYAKAPTTLEP